MRTKTSSGIFLFIISLIVFFAGTGLCIMNHWDKTLPMNDVHNLKAIARAAFLTAAEYVFFVGDFRLMNAKKTAKKIGCAVVLVVLAGGMTWVIGEEWQAASKSEITKAAVGAISNIQSQGLAVTKTSSAKASITNEAIRSTTQITVDVLTDSTRAYQFSFFAALIGFITLHFCVEIPIKRSIGRGNVLTNNPQLQAKIQSLNLPAGAVKAYALKDGSGYSVFVDGTYKAFVKSSEVGDKKRKVGF